ncbi:MAG: HK97 family phage prohead protease [Pseudomonadota bacterium]
MAERVLAPAAMPGVVRGYASRFATTDRGGDVVAPGAFARSLARLDAAGGHVRFLWQHDPAQPIGIWTHVAEDAVGLRVEGRLLADVQAGAEAAALLAAGAIDGLSIGYRAIRAEPRPGGGRRLLEIELWEVSLVTFPMLPTARASLDQPRGTTPGSAGMAGVLAGVLGKRARMPAAHGAPLRGLPPSTPQTRRDL